MSNHNGRTSYTSDIYSNSYQLSVHRHENNRLIEDIKQFEITKFQNADELNLLLNTAIQIKTHYFSIELQLLLHMPEKVLKIARKAFLSHRILWYTTKKRHNLFYS